MTFAERQERYAPRQRVTAPPGDRLKKETLQALSPQQSSNQVRTLDLTPLHTVLHDFRELVQNAAPEALTRANAHPAFYEHGIEYFAMIYLAKELMKHDLPVPDATSDIVEHLLGKSSGITTMLKIPQVIRDVIDRAVSTYVVQTKDHASIAYPHTPEDPTFGYINSGKPDGPGYFNPCLATSLHASAIFICNMQFTANRATMRAPQQPHPLGNQLGQAFTSLSHSTSQYCADQADDELLNLLPPTIMSKYTPNRDAASSDSRQSVIRARPMRAHEMGKKTTNFASFDKLGNELTNAHVGAYTNAYSCELDFTQPGEAPRLIGHNFPTNVHQAAKALAIMYDNDYHSALQDDALKAVAFPISSPLSLYENPDTTPYTLLAGNKHVIPRDYLNTLNISPQQNDPRFFHQWAISIRPQRIYRALADFVPPGLNPQETKAYKNESEAIKLHVKASRTIFGAIKLGLNKTDTGYNEYISFQKRESKTFLVQMSRVFEALDAYQSDDANLKNRSYNETARRTLKLNLSTESTSESKPISHLVPTDGIYKYLTPMEEDASPTFLHHSSRQIFLRVIAHFFDKMNLVSSQVHRPSNEAHKVSTDKACTSSAQYFAAEHPARQTLNTEFTRLETDALCTSTAASKHVQARSCVIHAQRFFSSAYDADAGTISYGKIDENSTYDEIFDVIVKIQDYIDSGILAKLEDSVHSDADSIFPKSGNKETDSPLHYSREFLALLMSLDRNFPGLSRSKYAHLASFMTNDETSTQLDAFPIAISGPVHTNTILIKDKPETITQYRARKSIVPHIQTHGPLVFLVPAFEAITTTFESHDGAEFNLSTYPSIQPHLALHCDKASRSQLMLAYIPESMQYDVDGFLNPISEAIANFVPQISTPRTILFGRYPYEKSWIETSRTMSDSYDDLFLYTTEDEEGLPVTNHSHLILTGPYQSRMLTPWNMSYSVPRRSTYYAYCDKINGIVSDLKSIKLRTPSTDIEKKGAVLKHYRLDQAKLSQFLFPNNDTEEEIKSDNLEHNAASNQNDKNGAPAKVPQQPPASASPIN